MFIVGLIGGILGAVVSAFALFIALIGVSMGLGDGAGPDSSVVLTGSFVACLVSVLAIVGAVISKSKPKMAGAFHLTAAVAGFLGISFLYFVPSILLITSGIMGLSKRKTASSIEA